MNAQVLDVRQTLVDHNNEQRFALAVNFEAPPKEVKEAWTDFIKSELDIKMKGFGFLSNKDLLSAERVSIPQISENKLSFYTLFQETDDEEEIIMNVFVAFGYDIYLNRREYPEEYAVLRDMVNQFVHGFVPAYYQEQIDATSEVVNDLEEEIADLNKEVEKNKKDIEKNQKEIEELKSENESLMESISENSNKLNTKKQLLTQQQGKLQTVEEELKN
jgi:methyl-accepting chemotaxis protein